MTTIISIIAFVAVALVGWAVAELKRKAEYVAADDEQASLGKYLELPGGVWKELNIDDVIRTISAKGFDA